MRLLCFHKPLFQPTSQNAQRAVLAIRTTELPHLDVGIWHIRKQEGRWFLQQFVYENVNCLYTIHNYTNITIFTLQLKQYTLKVLYLVCRKVL